MKKSICLLFLHVWVGVSSAQLSSLAKPLYLAQATIRSDEIMWWEAGLIYLGRNHIGFQLKTSSRANFTYFDQNSSLYSNYKINYYNQIGNIDFSSRFTYLKPGLILLQHQNKTRSFYLAINGVLGFSKNKLRIHFTDPLLGSTELIELEDKINKGIELEGKFNFDMGKYAAFTVGLTLGASRAEEKLFVEVYEGAFKDRNNYAPGMGMNADSYFILSTGFLLKLH